MKEDKVVQEGWVVLTNTISGEELIWSVEEPGEGGIWPEVFLSEQEARVAMIDDLYEDLRQYKESERQWEEILWPDNEYTIGQIEIYESGAMIVWEGSQKYLNRIISTDLKTWRENL